MSETAVICMSLYYEDEVLKWTEKDNNLYGTIRRMPKCKFDSCPFTADVGVWCPLKDLSELMEEDEDECNEKTE